MAALKFCLLILISLSAPAFARVAQYTQNNDDSTHVALGFAVPMPVASTSALAGFRDYNSLLASLDLLALQHADFNRHNIGTSFEGRPIYAYVFGRNEQAVMLQSGGIHAREWASPEAVTAIAEQLTAHADDGSLETWLRDHSSIVLIPVLNPDGFLSTQVHADQTRVGQDPDDSGRPTTTLAKNLTPRDGRMRRKNLRNSDGELETAGDTLLGVDLNRNIERFFVSNRASSDPRSLVYNGPADASEPEIQALIQASQLLPSENLRLFVDTHSFGRIFFYNQTPNVRLFQITQDLVDGIRNAPAKDYQQAAEQTGVRIGATDEYFSYNLQVPSYTLELEPGVQMQAAEYGGNPQVSHSGFILPEAEVPRMRDEVYQMMRLAYYRQAGPAILQGYTLTALNDNSVVASAQWQATGQARTLQFEQSQLLQNGQGYRLQLIFDKPMRWRNTQGQIVAYPGQAAPLPPQIVLQSGAQSFELNSSTGAWQDQQYQTDTFSVEFTLPSALAGRTQLRVDVQDLAGQALDGNPATPVTWSQGRWQQLENADGTSGDSGGPDHNLYFDVAGTPLSASGGGSGSLSIWLLTLMLLDKRRRA